MGHALLEVAVDAGRRWAMKAMSSAVAAARPPLNPACGRAPGALARMAVLFRFAELIEQNALELGLLDSLDVGKPVTEAVIGDVPAAALTFQCFAKTIDKIEGIVTNTAHDAFYCILRLVACIAPWNYPLLMVS
jgi:acyl-CoA reductase-like NAD-dependent aldehyde dehydrogenase